MIKIHFNNCWRLNCNRYMLINNKFINLKSNCHKSRYKNNMLPLNYKLYKLSKPNGSKRKIINKKEKSKNSNKSNLYYHNKYEPL